MKVWPVRTDLTPAPWQLEAVAELRREMLFIATLAFASNRHARKRRDGDGAR